MARKVLHFSFQNVLTVQKLRIDEGSGRRSKMALLPPFSSFLKVVREKAPFSSLPVIVSLRVRKCLASIMNEGARGLRDVHEDPALRRSLHVVR